MQNSTELSPNYSAKWVGYMSVAQLIGWGSTFYTFTLLMGPVEMSLGLSRVESSFAFSLALLAEGLLAYPVGRWIDRGYERRVMTLGSLLAALCLFAHGFVEGRIAFYAVWCGMGVAMSATLYTPVFAVVTRRYPGDFRRAIITMTFLGGLASTVFIPLTAWLMEQLGWRHAMWCLAGLQLLVCAPLHFHLLRASSNPAHIAHHHAHVAALGAAPYMRSMSFVMVGVFMVLMMAVTVALPTHMVSLLRDHGMSEAWVVAIPASIGVIQVIGRVLMYFFEQHFDVHLANRVIPALMPLGLLLLIASPWAEQVHQALVLAFVLVWGLGNGMLTIVKGTAMALYVNRRHVASLNGALGVPLALARSAAPLGLGYLWTPQGGYASGLWVLLGISLVAMAALVLAQQHAEKV